MNLYFAYGSNMSTRRLLARVSAAQPLGCARLEGWQLRCNKRGVDGSGKANLVPDLRAEAWGVLFELETTDWPILDGFEPGYRRGDCAVQRVDGSLHTAHLYVATSHDEVEIPPFDWYLAHLIEGAREHQLPRAYIRALERWTAQRTAIDD